MTRKSVLVLVLGALAFTLAAVPATSIRAQTAPNADSDGATASVSIAQVKDNKFKLTTNIWQEKSNGKGSWIKAAPEGQWTYVLSDANANEIERFTDAQDLDLADGDYTVTLFGPTGGSGSATVYDFVLSENGNSDCKTPPGGKLSLKLRAADFAENGTAHACAFLKESAPLKVAEVRKSFVSASDNVVTWKLEPASPASITVWDAAASGCTAHNGADCGEIGKNGPGSFSAAGTGEYLLVTQSFEKSGESCEVVNTAEYAAAGSNAKQSVTATYKCSGASTMGWGLFALFVAAAGSMAWVVQRKFEWSR